MRRYCFALDLKDDETLIAEYERLHKNVWPEVLASIKESGIENMEIYRCQNRLFMIIDVSDSFSFADKAASDASNIKVRAWEALMWNFQQSLPGSKPGEKWVLMNPVFKL